MAVSTTSEPQSRPDDALVDKLYFAAAAGDLHTVNQALIEGVDIDSYARYRGTALCVAVARKNEDVVRLLLERGANPNDEGDDSTPLCEAAKSGNLPLVQLLLDNGADISATNEGWGDAFHAACYGGNLSVVEFLFGRGADPYVRCGKYVTSLLAAAMSYDREGAVSIVRFLLDIGCDVNDHGGEFGSPLQGAIYEANLPLIQLFLDRGADVNTQCGTLGNALQLAAAQGAHNLHLLFSGRFKEDAFLAIVQLLLDRGANVNAQGGHYGNALHAAIYAQFRSHRIATLLLEKGASPCFRARSPDGSSILHEAISSKNRDFLKILLEKGGNLHLHPKDNSGWTPLHSAVILKNFASLELLGPYIDKADLDTIDIDGNTPLHSAVDGCAANIVEWLVGKGANAALQDSEAMTPFQQAGKKNNFPALCSLFANTPKEFRDVKASKWRASYSEEHDRNIVVTDAIKILTDEELRAYLRPPSDEMLFVDSAWALTVCVSGLSDSIFADDLGQEFLVESLATNTHAVYVGHGGVGMEKGTHLPDDQIKSLRLLRSVSSPQNKPVSFTVREANHAIGWIMVKQNPSRGETNSQSDLETKFLFSTLEYVNIPSSPTDLFLPLAQQLSDEWSDVYEAAVKHLSRMATLGNIPV
ncbi:Ankyrin-2 [Onygenales sp. PD_12]|nr:Ankyrin-2 [Onygenales sp. PD_12]